MMPGEPLVRPGSIATSPGRPHFSFSVSSDSRRRTCAGCCVVEGESIICEPKSTPCCDCCAALGCPTGACREFGKEPSRNGNCCWLRRGLLGVRCDSRGDRRPIKCVSLRGISSASANAPSTPPPPNPSPSTCPFTCPPNAAPPNPPDCGNAPGRSCLLSPFKAPPSGGKSSPPDTWLLLSDLEGAAAARFSKLSSRFDPKPNAACCCACCCLAASVCCAGRCTALC